MFEEDLHITDTFPPVSYEQWLEAAGAAVRLSEAEEIERRLAFDLDGELTLRPFYSSLDQVDPHRSIGGMSGWDIRQEHVFADPVELNRAVLDDVEHGATSVQIRIDESDRIGSADFETVFSDVPLDRIGVALDAGAAFGSVSESLVSLWDKRQIEPGDRYGAFNADPLGALSPDVTSVDEALSEMADLAVRTGRWKKVTAVGVDTSVYYNAGASETQDIAFSIATGIAYLRAMERACLDVNAAAGQILFRFDIGCDFFTSIAKLRAVRLLWSKVIAASGGDATAGRMKLHARTAQRVLTGTDPSMNILRNTVCCFAAVTAGADVVTTVAHDSANGIPSDLDRRMARNAQILWRDESNLHRVVDPAGGAWFIEQMTEQFAQRAWSVVREIESMGGMINALTGGWVREQIDIAKAQRLDREGGESA